jgi:DNA-binding transcriptional ArsR family regulator
VGHNPRLLRPVGHEPQSVRRRGRGVWATTPAYWGLCATTPISAIPTRILFLTIKVVGWKTGLMIDVAVIDDPAAAEAALEPGRARLLAQLTEPRSAAMLAAAIGLTRQKVNYHLRTLEQHGLIELVEERRKGNMTERLLQATAASYVISPSALAAVAPDPARAPDRLSARWLLALAAQLVRDVGDLITGAARAQRKLATFAMDGTVRFASPADRAAFTAELMQVVTSLVAKYHDEQAEGGREHHLVVAVHPSLTARPDAQVSEAVS